MSPPRTSPQAPAVVVVRTPVAPADVPGMCARARRAVAASPHEVVTCDVSAVTAPDAVVVDALARMQLEVRRRGHRVELRGASPELLALLRLAGLCDAVPSAAEPTGGVEVATYVLIHGACGSAWSWSPVAAELRLRGHEVVAVDLPCDRNTAGFDDYADTVVAAVGQRGQRGGLVVVGHSLGAYTAGLVCTRLPVELCVLVAGMVPAPGETPMAMFAEAEQAAGPDAEATLPTGEPDRSLAASLADVPRELALEALARDRDQSATPMHEPWPLTAWPDVPTRFLLCREDRILPAAWLRRAVPERLGIVPDELDGSHAPHLSRPVELVDRLEAYRAKLGSLASIGTDRLVLRPLILEAARDLAGYRDRPPPGLTFADGYPLDDTRLTAKLHLLARASGIELGPFGRFQLVERDRARVVGDIGFHSAPRPDGSVELTYAVAPSQRRRGLATEAVRGLTAWAFALPGVTCVRAETVAGDPASPGVLRAAGFEHVGRGPEGRDRFLLPRTGGHR